MSVKSLGVRLFCNKNYTLYINDKMSKAMSLLDKIAKRENAVVDCKPVMCNGKLNSIEYNIDNIIKVVVDSYEEVYSIEVADIYEHEIINNKQMYRYDNLNEAGFSLIRASNLDLAWSLDDTVSILDEVGHSNESERAVLFGNDKRGKVAYAVYAVSKHLTKLVITNYCGEYPFKEYKETGLEW